MENEQLSPKELHDLIENEFHSSNKLWGEVATAYANSAMMLFDDTIKFVYQALTAMGLVAGFGFAGIQGVQNFFFFSLGESIMFGSMMFGFYRIKIIYTKNSESIEEASKKIKDAYQKKAIALSEMMKEVRTTGKINEKTNVKQYEEANKEISELFGIGKPGKKNKDESWFITVMIIMFSIGFGFLLFSFSPKDELKKHKANFFQKEHQVWMKGYTE